MKKGIAVFCLLLLVLCVAIIFGEHEVDTRDYLRIHIRANSNSDIDQDVKYKVKGEIVSYLSPKLKGCKDSVEARNIVLKELDNLDKIANRTLSNDKLPYRAKSSVRYEHFPVRHYGNLTLEEGIYESLIIELGKADGDNWWCVVFPPLCFVKSEEVGSKDFEYVSKIEELIGR